MAALYLEEMLNIRAVTISCLVLGIASVVRGAESNAPPDAVYFHGRIYTVDDRLGEQSAFAVRDDRIARWPLRHPGASDPARHDRISSGHHDLSTPGQPRRKSRGWPR